MSGLRKILAGVSDFDALGKKSGIDPARLQALANGKEPKLAELRHLSTSLKVSISSLVLDEKADDKSKILFRNAGVEGVEVNDVTVEQLYSKFRASKVFVGSQPYEASLAWKAEFKVKLNSAEEAAEAASTFRSLFFNDDQLGPLHSLPKIVAERLGAILFVTRSSDFDGASAIIDGVAFAFVSARYRPRMLFTLAHEVGHLVAHHDIHQPFAVVDEDVEIGLSSSTEEERFANLFASELLMPSSGVALTLKKIREVAGSDEAEIGDIEINLLSRIYGVSFWAAALRCEALGLIPRGGAFALQEHVTKAHGSPEKRADELGLPARSDIHFPPVPSALLQSAVKNIKEGAISIGKAAALLELSVSDLMAENAPLAH